MATLGSEEYPLRVAIVGAGPAGFYTAQALLRAPVTVHIDFFEKLAAPYGLVRSGVAPDHPKLKEPIRVFHGIAESANVRYLGNVDVGVDLSVSELAPHYHAVVLSYGAASDRRLGIPGEDLPGSHTATEFVGWYNGHPDYRDRTFDLSCDVAAVIGQGNVALDVARTLAKTADELMHTDMTRQAQEVLAESRIREIHIIGRRGPAQAKFTKAELEEFNRLDDCTAALDPHELQLNPASIAERDHRQGRSIAKNLELFEGFALRTHNKRRRAIFRFLLSPKAITGEDRVESLVLERNRLQGEPFHQTAAGTGETHSIRCGIVFRSIGYRGLPQPGLPFDSTTGVIPNQNGRILSNGELLHGLYVAGWIKRGPSGRIGTNKADAAETVAALLADLPHLPAESRAGADALLPILRERSVQVVSYEDWMKIDAAEIERGIPARKPREKFTRTEEMLALLD